MLRHFLVLLVTLLLPAIAGAERLRIDLLTMGPGDDPFTRFGHAALCVVDEDRGEERAPCYNYGTADFTTPGPLTWAFLRGRARFWVSTMPYGRVLSLYASSDRTVWAQTLPLDDRAATDLARRVRHDRRPENRFYVYHHFHDNCTTRLRDHVDAVTGGRLSRRSRVPLGPTYRQLVREGFTGDTALLLLTEIVLGRAADARPTVWEAMFHPAVLREEVRRRLGVRPEVLARRRAPLPHGGTGRGRNVLLALALVLAAVVAAALRSGRLRLALAVAGLVLGLIALVLEGLAAVSHLPELRVNELLLVFVPTDFALPFLQGPRLRSYLRARLGLLAVVALAALVGLLVQPLGLPLLVVALPLGVAFAMSRRGPDVL